MGQGGTVVTGESQEAVTLYFDRLRGCKVTDVRKDGGVSYVLLSLAVGLSI